jgi:hypothetical protein
MASAQSQSLQVLNEVREGKSLSLSGVARLFPGRSGRPMNPSTIYRWIISGVKLPDGSRLQLEAVRVGHRMLTSMPAVERFIAANTASHSGDVDPPHSPAQRRRAAEAADAELDSLGM